jgi:hypothetical protein
VAPPAAKAAAARAIIGRLLFISSANGGMTIKPRSLRGPLLDENSTAKRRPAVPLRNIGEQTVNEAT